MTQHQKIFAIIATVTMMLFILELVRRRKIKEEYAWLWMLVGVIAPVLIIWSELLTKISDLIGAVEPWTTISIFTFLFLILLNIHYSTKITNFSNQIRKMAQQIGILTKEVEDLKKENRNK